MAMLDPNKAWSLFMIDPVDFLIALGAVIAFFGGGAWCVRGQIVKERLELLRSQRDDLDNKLIEAKENNAKLQRQIDARASSAELSATASSTSGLFDELKIVSDRMGVTLGVTSGQVRVIFPDER